MTGGALAGKAVAQVVAGNVHTCALDTAGQAYCWGLNQHGELGDASTDQRTTPVAVDTAGLPAGTVLARLAIGMAHTCAVDTAGKGYCWGDNGGGRLGDATTTERHAPVAVDTAGVLSGATLTVAGAGSAHTCAADTSGKGYCWGDNGGGRLGDATTTERHAPAAVDTAGVLSGAVLVDVTTGHTHTCALDATGSAYCWGTNTSGQLGDGTTTDRTSPVAVADPA